MPGEAAAQRETAGSADELAETGARENEEQGEQWCVPAGADRRTDRRSEPGSEDATAEEPPEGEQADHETLAVPGVDEQGDGEHEDDVQQVKQAVTALPRRDATSR